MTTILIKKKDTAGAPVAGDLTNAAGGAEIAVNTATKRIYTKDSGGNVVEIGTNPSGTTMAGNLLFSPDNTYDIGASGATRARNLFLAGNITAGGSQTLTGALTVDSTTDSSSTTTGSIQTDGGMGIAKALFVGTTANIAGVATFSAGTAALPAITTSGDTNTGIFFPAADTIAFSEGGTESMRINSSGNVGIGTSTVLSGRLNVQVDATNNISLLTYRSASSTNSGYSAVSMWLNDSAATPVVYGALVPNITVNTAGAHSGSVSIYTTNAGTLAEKMRVAYDGNVGIGTTTPVGKFDVFASSGGGAGTVVPVSITVGDTSAGNLWPGDGTLSTVFNYYSGDGTNTGVRFRHGVGETAVSGSTSVWKIQYRAAGGAINDYTGFSDALTVDGVGSVRIDNYMGVGGAGTANVGVRIRNTALTGATQIGAFSTITAASDAVSAVWGFLSTPATSAAAFTSTNVAGFSATDAVKGAASTITNLHGLYISDQTQGTNNYGITSLVSSGTNKWNIYASGTAQNYFAGNVGIGTTSPSAKLYVQSANTNALVINEILRNPNSGTGIAAIGFNVADTSEGDYTQAGIGLLRGIANGSGSLCFYNKGSGTASNFTTADEKMRIDSSGNVGIGTSSPIRKLTVSSAGAVEFVLQDTSQAANSRNWRIFNAGNTLYFGTLNDAGTAGNDYLKIDSSGIVTMSAYGAGAATFSASGVISSVSDETWKIKDGVPVDVDSMLNKLEPGYWYYNDEKKETFGSDRQLGFYAQNVNAAIGPEAAPVPEEGKPWGYYDRSVLAVTVMSLQKALATIESLTARIAALEST